jgi:hypothetical protein
MQDVRHSCSISSPSVNVYRLRSVGSRVKWPILFEVFLIKIGMCRQSFVALCNTNLLRGSRHICSGVLEVIYVDRRTDSHGEANRRTLNTSCHESTDKQIQSMIVQIRFLLQQSTCFVYVISLTSLLLSSFVPFPPLSFCFYFILSLPPFIISFPLSFLPCFLLHSPFLLHFSLRVSCSFT